VKKDIYNKEFVRDLFNRMSSSYERMNYITSFGFSIRWRKQFITETSARTFNPVILDLLCGMGETWPHVKRIFPNAKITAVDFSKNMIKEAIHRNNKRFGGLIMIENQDVLQNDLPSNHFDIIVCGFGLKTFNEEQLEALGLQVFRLLKSGGTFSFVEVSEPNNSILYAFYSFYVGKVIPILGKLFLGNPSDYKMLWRYTKNFKNGESSAKAFEKAGLSVQYKNYFFGCASGIYGVKK